jgi:signal transduction histidine kinase
MVSPAPHLWSALIIHLTEGASNLVQLLEQQGYELAEAWDGPVAWQTAGPALLDLAHLDLTHASQSGTILFVRTIGQLCSPIVAVTEVPDGAVPGHPGRSYLLRRTEARNGSVTSAATSGEAEQCLRHELTARSSTHLARGLAHDANNLLTVIANCTKLLQHEELSPAARTHVDDIRAASDRTAVLLHQLGNLCRGQFHSPRVFDLNTVILDLHRLIGRLLGDDVTLALDLERRPCLVKGDPLHLEQVLLNLAVNARDAIRRRGFFAIATTTLPETGARLPLRPGRYVRLTVRDNGCGMPEAIKSRIFEPFFTTKAPGLGTGIGLATVDRIIKQSGGRIDVDSVPGIGTSFTIYLPEASPEVEMVSG